MGKHFFGKEIKGRVDFSKAALKTTVTFLTKSCYFNVGNLTMKEFIGFPMSCS